MNVNIDTLLKVGISIQEYLFLQLIKNKQKTLLIDYYSVFNKLVEVENIQKLMDLGYLSAKDMNSKSFENFSVTPEFIKLTEVRLDDVIEDIKRVYPKQTPSGTRKGLQNDVNKWSANYLKAVNRDRALHDKVMMCIEAEKIHRKHTKQEEFWPLLTTYINNRRWEAYIDEIDNLNLAIENIFQKDI